ncbi:MAG: N,N-dimethylformamidase, partial [Alphaproteobacteria bacterium]|nr:N,N-dimethylformamidase [Alphaproteobacteria bacterium]
MHQLTGYVDRWSARAGETVRFMVSSMADRAYDLRFVRHLCADPNPDGPGFREALMPHALAGRKPGRAQNARPGSYATIEAMALPTAGGLALSVRIWPTTPTKGRQVILSLEASGTRVELALGADGSAELTVGDRRIAVGHAMLKRRWYQIEASIDPAGRGLAISQTPLAPVGTITDGGRATAAASVPALGGIARVTIAARREAGNASQFFNGKIERPTIAALDGTLAASWDFSQGIATQRIVDRGPQAAHGALVNLPTRAMTGANWTGEVHDWKSAPEQYGAIHFHDDDMGDCGWSESFALEIPKDWPSGFYAAHIRNEAGEDYIPFFVRPARGAKHADVAFVVPTFSYQVYSCYVRPGRSEEIRELSLKWDALLET